MNTIEEIKKGHKFKTNLGEGYVLLEEDKVGVSYFYSLVYPDGKLVGIKEYEIYNIDVVSFQSFQGLKYFKEEEQALRYNTGKLQWSLVDYESLEPMVRVLEFGAKKYAPDNWKKGMPVLEVCESMLRHIYAFMAGEDNDPESNESHIGHIQCNAMFLAYIAKHKEQFDNRRK